MFRYLFTFLTFIVSLSCGTAQSNALLDSLRNELSRTDADSNRVEIHLQIADNLVGVSWDSCVSEAEKALELSLKTDYSRGTGKAYRMLGFANMFLGDHDLATRYGEHAIDIFKELKDTLGLIKAYNLLGVIALKQEDKANALGLLFGSVDLAEKVGSNRSIASSYNNIGEVFAYSNDSINALKYYKKAYEYIQKTNHTHSTTIVLINIANHTRNIDQKIIYLDKAIALASVNGFHSSLGYAYAALGDIYYNNYNDFVKSLANYRLGLSSARISGDVKMTAYNLMYMAGSFLERSMIDSALVYINNVNYKNLEENLRKDFLYLKAKILRNDGRTNLAYDLLDSSLQNHINYYNNNLAKEISDANARFESEKKELEIDRQQLLIARRESQRNLIFITSLLVLSIVITIASWIYNKNKRKQKESIMALDLEKEKNDNLKKISELKTELFNNISHEIRTPLTLIIAPLETVYETVKNINIKNQLEIAISNARKILSLTNEILDLSKIEAGKMKMQSSRIDLVKILHNTRASFNPLAMQSNIKILLDTSSLGKSYWMETDAGQLQKILDNLISNAIRYSPEGSSVSINTFIAAKDRIGINIVDQGIGISPEDSEKIFERYYQSNRETEVKGTGIGLSLSLELSRLLGGDIQLNSTVGKGSCFTLFLPARHSNSLQLSNMPGSYNNALKEKSDLLADPGTRLRFLIVEDDNDMATYLVDLLKDMAICDRAENGIEALKKIELHSYDLVASDIMMPEMDGFAFRQNINNRKYNHIPFIMITARTLEEDLLKGFRMGIDDYITKPFSPAELKARISALLKNKYARDNIDLEDKEAIPFEHAFVNRARSLVTQHMSSSEFNVSQFAAEMNYSTRQLSRLLQKYSGFTPVEFILEVRLQSAYMMIQAKSYATVNEIRYSVGIDSASYFNRSFKSRFGINPGRLLKSA